VARANRVAAASGPDGSGARVPSVLTSEHFTALFDMFDAEHRPALSKAMLQSLNHAPGAVTDPVVVNTCVQNMGQGEGDAVVVQVRLTCCWRRASAIGLQLGSSCGWDRRDYA